MELPRAPHRPGKPPGIDVGDRVPLVVLGMGRVSAVVERVDELVQEGVRGLAWRVELRLPNGDIAHGIKRGHARLIFLDPRHRSAEVTCGFRSPLRLMRSETRKKPDSGRGGG